MAKKPKALSVRILGKDYLVGCPEGEEAALLQSAKHVDGKMNEIRKVGKVVGTDRIAVMAALNLAHEMLSSTNQVENIDKKAMQKLKQIELNIFEAVDKYKKSQILLVYPHINFTNIQMNDLTNCKKCISINLKVSLGYRLVELDNALEPNYLSRKLNKALCA